MKIAVTMPQMGESIIEGTVIQWRKQVGELVQRDEILLEISTDKVDTEIPSPATGLLAEIIVPDGETAQIGATLAYLETEEIGTEPVAKLSGGEVKVARAESPVNISSPQPKIDEKIRRPFLSPLVRRLAQEHQLSLAQLQQIPGSGLNGRITRDDVLAYLQRPKTAPKQLEESAGTARPQAEPSSGIPKPEYSDQQVTVVRMDHIRKSIAERMLKSVQTSPHVATFAEVDMSRIVTYRERVKEEFARREGVPLTYTAFFVETAAIALKAFPYLNASVEEDKIILKKPINIGVAVAVGQNIIVPVVKNADQKNLVGIARELSELAEKARTKKLLPADVQDGTFSITNPGIFGNTVGIAIIHQPQVAILDFGAIKKRPVVINDAIAIRSMLMFSLSYDHRIIDGALAAKFSQRIVQLLETYDLDKIPEYR